MVEFTLGTLRARPPADGIALAAWDAYAAAQPHLVDSVCHRTGAPSKRDETIRRNAKDINVGEQQAITFWWFSSGEITVHFALKHKELAQTETSRLCNTLQCEFHPVSEHFSNIERMICNIDDFAAQIEFRHASGVDSRLAVLEYTTTRGGEFLYLHFVDTDLIDDSPLTRVDVADIINITPSPHRVADL